MVSCLVKPVGYDLVRLKIVALGFTLEMTFFLLPNREKGRRINGDQGETLVS